MYPIPPSKATRFKVQPAVSTPSPRKHHIRIGVRNHPSSGADIIRQDPLRIDAPTWVRYNTSPPRRTGAIP